ncbi:MAG: hypothetical protein WCP77_18860 [Roseococcus sp.]
MAFLAPARQVMGDPRVDRTDKGEVSEFDAVVCTIPAPQVLQLGGGSSAAAQVWA